MIAGPAGGIAMMTFDGRPRVGEPSDRMPEKWGAALGGPDVARLRVNVVLREGVCESAGPRFVREWAEVRVGDTILFTTVRRCRCSWGRVTGSHDC